MKTCPLITLLKSVITWFCRYYPFYQSCLLFSSRKHVFHLLISLPKHSTICCPEDTYLNYGSIPRTWYRMPLLQHGNWLHCWNPSALLKPRNGVGEKWKISLKSTIFSECISTFCQWFLPISPCKVIAYTHTHQKEKSKTWYLQNGRKTLPSCLSWLQELHCFLRLLPLVKAAGVVVVRRGRSDGGVACWFPFVWQLAW